MSTPKTVYILGAGFSIPGGGPSQEAILSEIWNLPDDAETEGPKRAFREFLRSGLNVDETIVSLEDVYTPIDRCLADGLAFRDRTEGQLQILREQISYLISRAIQNKFTTGPVWNAEYVPTFAKYLVQKAAIRAERAKGTESKRNAKEYDPFSIISLNWDVLLDNAFNKALEAHDGEIKSDYGPYGVVDYCCYISSLHSDDRRTRTGLWSLGCRGYNIKLLKIHGSMNWLQCPNCQQLFVAFDEKYNVVNYTNPYPCRHCRKHGHNSILRDSLVMPTFLKDLSNFQVKLIWQNAGVELMEARHLVFIGYSLPHADFEFRQLLSRMVHRDTTVHVVLYRDTRSEDLIRKYESECERYAQFFSTRKIGETLTFEPGGVVEFVKKLTAAHHQPEPQSPNNKKAVTQKRRPKA